MTVIHMGRIVMSGGLLQNGEKQSRGLIECHVMQELLKWARRPLTSVKHCKTMYGTYEARAI